MYGVLYGVPTITSTYLTPSRHVLWRRHCDQVPCGSASRKGVGEEDWLGDGSEGAGMAKRASRPRFASSGTSHQINEWASPTAIALCSMCDVHR